MTRGEDTISLVDRWKELGQEHVLEERSEHDPWPRSVCWTRFRTLCSCGWEGPVVSATEAEVRNDPHLMSHVNAHRQLHYMKHLVQELLSKDWTEPRIWSS